jgi:co-chaperonin GroES (HSP10)
MNFKPLGKWVVVKTVIESQKTTATGIVYNDFAVKTGGYIWSDVIAIGCGLDEDIQPGDRVWWSITNKKGNRYQDYDLVHQDHIEAVDRE